MQPTPEQQQAIDARGHTLLVSAAAGSGKTATLTQRIITRLTDPAHPTELSRLLVVTFTRAAARELRERIGSALRKALARDPKNAHLTRQLLLLPGAKIRTIDSFCNDLVRQNADLIGFPTKFRIADEAEGALLRRDVLEELLHDGYAGTLPGVPAADFCTLSDALCTLWQEKNLSEVLDALHAKVSSYREKGGLFLSVAESITGEEEFFRTPWGKVLYNDITGKLSDLLQQFRVLGEEIEKTGIEKEQAQLPVIEQDCALLQRLLTAAQEGYTPLRRAYADAAPAKRPNLPKERSAAAAVYADLRADWAGRAGLKPLPALRYTEEELQDACRQYASLHRTLGAVLTEFDRRYTEEKFRRGLCDYNDLEHGALHLLTDDTGAPTPLARSLGSAYEEIYIDEYQDVNAIQHDIFCALAGERNRFMVGDIKQSIYCFRGSRPDIFRTLRQTYPPLSDILSGQAPDGPCASLFMTRNFRSFAPVLDFANGIFRFLFTHAGDSIGYLPEDDLFPGRPDAHNPAVPLPHVGIFPSKAESEETEEDGQGAPEETPEVTFVAEEIRRLLREEHKADGTPFRPGDMAILLRTSTPVARYAAALTRRGIPVNCPDKRSFFLNEEILLALCLLNVINNPYRDVYLAGLARSPIYRFSLDELLLLRKHFPAPSLYESMLAFAQANPGEEKTALLLSEIADFRRFAEGLPADRLLRLLYRKTSLLSLADKSGRANLLLLYQYARSFEATSYRGLYRFIHYINQIIAAKRSFRPPDTVGGEDAVQIMTVHASKGLQFPVTFVSTAQGRKKAGDLPFHPTLGVGFSLRDATGMVQIRPPLRDAVLAANRESEAEESMRVLYVALTRAEERVYVTGSSPYPDNLRLAAEQLALCPSRYAVLQADSWSKWVLAGAVRGTFLPIREAEQAAEEPSAPSAAETPAPDAPPAPPSEPEQELPSTTAEEERLSTLFRERFSYRYPYEAQTVLPAKLSVSRLYPEVLDEPDAAALPQARQDDQPPAAPAFLAGTAPDSAAKAGTATHLFLQFCDFEKLARNGVEAELTREVQEHFLSAQDAERVNRQEAEAFRHSSLFAELRQARELHREFRFHALFPARDFTVAPDRRDALATEQILVQGVMDCLYLSREGKLVLVDYKTDRLPPHALQNRQAARKILQERHAPQLYYYAQAVEKIFGRAPDEVLIYSLTLGDTVPLSVLDGPAPL